MRSLLLACVLLTGAAAPISTALHLTLVDSNPREGATVSEAPGEILLKFNERLDPERRAIALRGPAGTVTVGAVRTVDTLSFAVPVTGAMGPGSYTVSWMAGAPDHATIRGRYSFVVSREQ